MPQLRDAANSLASGDLEELADLLVGDLREVLVAETHRMEWLRRDRAHDVVDISRQILAREIGIPTTMRAGRCVRSATTATRIVDPVASASSTKMMERSATGSLALFPR